MILFLEVTIFFFFTQFMHSCDLKGHTDWIRSLDFSLPILTNGESNCLLLVSSSQDKSIRIWKVALCSSVATSKGDSSKERMSLASYIEGPIIAAGSSSYRISLESLLIGHEDWVYSVQWQPPSIACVLGAATHQPESILSASMDKTMMIWQPERTTGIWMNVVTVGELSHCALGFYGGHWNPNGNSILAHGYGGSFHLWKNVGVNFDNWLPQKVPSGHYAAVTDISWAMSGEYIVSVSHDQVICLVRLLSVFLICLNVVSYMLGCSFCKFGYLPTSILFIDLLLMKNNFTNHWPKRL